MSISVGVVKAKRQGRIEKTAGGYVLRDGRRWIRISKAEAFRFWLAMGLALDRELEGQINKATSGGLGALRRAYAVGRRNARRRD